MGESQFRDEGTYTVVLFISTYFVIFTFIDRTEHPKSEMEAHFKLDFKAHLEKKFFAYLGRFLWTCLGTINGLGLQIC
jgi:hypothetical protein